MNKIKAIIFFLTVMLLTACSDSLTSLITGDGEIATGDPVQFTTYVPDIQPTTRSLREQWEKRVKAYKAVQHAYKFSIQMVKEGETTATATALYSPTYTTKADIFDEITGDNGEQVNDGTLKVQEGQTPLYWQDNVNPWGFKVETVSTDLALSDGTAALQNNQDRWLAMDKLTGNSYLPIWNGTNDDDQTEYDTNTPDKIQYRTSKDWYKGNKTAHDLEGLMVNSNEDYKKVPLYLKHERAWITVILKAGEGVKREALRYRTAARNIRCTINSYASDEATPLAIDSAWAKETLVNYQKDANGEAAQGVSSTRYDAIVMPHNYAAHKDDQVITRISLSSQTFSFYAANDTRYVNGTAADKTEADGVYNLQAGKHLTLEVTLSRESRKVLITAWVEDWTEAATQTICDDYGQNGDPIIIKNKADLKAFLSDVSKNTYGNVGIIQPAAIDLEEGGDWDGAQYELKATLNMAGCVLSTQHQFLKGIAASGNIVNGTVEVKDNTTVDYAIAAYNKGSIESLKVTTATPESTTAKATVAGIVGCNSGSINQCTSTLPVEGVSKTFTVGSKTYTGYIGGIAAVSEAEDASSQAVIDGCTVNAPVKSSADGVMGGGIVGYAAGRVSSCTYEYGITVSQPANNFKNIFARANRSLTANNNAWPTVAHNNITGSDTQEISNPNGYAGTHYNSVLDSQNELDKILNSSTYNAAGQTHRIARSFTVSSSNDDSKDWKHGATALTYSESNEHNNVLFTLEGNDKTITLAGNKTVTTWDGTKPGEGSKTTYTTAPMLFSYIVGSVKNLTLMLNESVVASPGVEASSSVYNSSDAIAPLAYAVYGNDNGTGGQLKNIKVKSVSGKMVQSGLPGGLVAWAYHGAIISGCQVKVPVRMWQPTVTGSQSRRYAGGIVGCAGIATLSQCSYYQNGSDAVSGATKSAQSSNCFYGGIVGGTAVKETDTPKLLITDCSSWFAAKRAETGATDQSAKGSIIGYTAYADGQTVRNGMSTTSDKGGVSAGNWWPLNAIGAHTWASGLSEERVIGKRNSVTPTIPQAFQ